MPLPSWVPTRGGRPCLARPATAAGPQARELLRPPEPSQTVRVSQHYSLWLFDSAAHCGEDLQVGFWLRAQGILHPLTILVKDPADDPAAPLKLAPPDLLQLLFQAQFQLLHLLLL